MRCDGWWACDYTTVWRKSEERSEARLNVMVTQKRRKRNGKRVRTVRRGL